MLGKMMMHDATVLCVTRNTTTEYGNTPEWDATSDQAAPKWHERDGYYYEADWVTNDTYRWAEALP